VIAQEEQMAKKNTIALAPLTAPLPNAMPLAQLRPGIWLHEWTSSGVLNQDIEQIPLESFIQHPLIPEQEHALLATTPTLLAAEHKRRAPKPSQETIEKTKAKFGVTIEQAPGYSINTLTALQKNWQAESIWQMGMNIQAPVTIAFDNSFVGVATTLFINDMPTKKDQLYHLKPGQYLLTALLKMNRRPPFLKKSSFKSVLRLESVGEPKRTYVDTPAPAGDSLFSSIGFEDPLADERAALDAWYAFTTQLKSIPVPTLHQDTQNLARAHPDTLTANQAAILSRILAQAPYDEKTYEQLTPRQRGALVYYYEKSGLSEKKWALKKSPLPVESFIDYYFLHEQQ
jgi:hypothetical protein